MRMRCSPGPELQRAHRPEAMQPVTVRKPPIEKSQPPSGGPTMYPSPVDISVMPSRKETRSGSTSAISAYLVKVHLYSG